MKFNIFNRSGLSDYDLPGVVRIKVEERRLSAANVESLRKKYLPLVSGQQKVVLELGHLSFIDSSGLGLLVGLRNAMLSPKKMVLEGVRDAPVLELIKLTRMDQVFYISPDSSDTGRLLNSE